MKNYEFESQPDAHVEDVAADAARHGHVAESFPGYNHWGDEIGNRGAGSEEGQAHDLQRIHDSLVV